MRKQEAIKLAKDFRLGNKFRKKNLIRKYNILRWIFKKQIILKELLFV